MKGINPISAALVFYLAIILAGFALGTFPQIIHPQSQYDSPVRFTLWGVLGAQVFFFMLIYPLVWMRRCEKQKTIVTVPILEVVFMMAAALPFYSVGWWFSDMSAFRLFQLLIALSAVIIWSLFCCLLIQKTPRSWTVVEAVNILVTLGGPAGIYIAMEFF